MTGVKEHLLLMIIIKRSQGSGGITSHDSMVTSTLPSQETSSHSSFALGVSLDTQHKDERQAYDSDDCHWVTVVMVVVVVSRGGGGKQIVRARKWVK